MNTKILISCILLVLAAASGIWLSRMGRPLNTVVFAAHKLIALAALILTITVTYPFFKNPGNDSMLLILMTAMSICYIVSFVSGGALSFEKEIPGIVIILHRIFSAATILLSAVISYLFIKSA